MPEQSPRTRNYGYILAALVIGFAAGCAIAAAVQSFGREPFTVDAVESMLYRPGSRHVVALAFGLTAQGAGIRSAACHLGLGLYRLVQGTRFALSARRLLSRWRA